MSVRAKFVCRSSEVSGDVRIVKLEAVSTGPGNESWSKYTPWGEVSLGITNPTAFNQFEVGKEYYLDFTAA